MTTFQNLKLPNDLPDLLAKIQFTTPTPIQEKAIPFALEGRDIIGSAQTGTGKTGAFVVPLIAYLMESDTSTALILTPTRELALQVMQFVTKLLGYKSYIKAALLIGGESMPKQLKQLQEKPRLIVGTPGRVNDHLKRRSLNLSKTHFLVLDEMDRMLDIGFGVQIDAIMKFLPTDRQTLMFSATLPKSIENLTAKYMKNPERIAIGSPISVAQNIQQETIHLSSEEKYPGLLKELEKREGSILVFVKTKRGAEKLSRKLKSEDHDADYIHGDLRQNQRARAVMAFSKRKYRILVATDIAARGLDIPHIEHVINYDLPQCPEDFIHRIGRTARAGAQGAAVTFIDPENRRCWQAIQKILNPSANDSAEPRERSGRSGSSRFERKKSNPSRFERFKGSKPRQDRPNRESSSSREGGFSDRKPSYGRREDRPVRNSSSSREGGFSDRKPSYGRREDRPNKDSSSSREGGFSDRKPSYGRREDRPVRDSSASREGGSFADKPRTSSFQGGKKPSFGQKKYFKKPAK